MPPKYAELIEHSSFPLFNSEESTEFRENYLQKGAFDYLSFKKPAFYLNANLFFCDLSHF